MAVINGGFPTYGVDLGIVIFDCKFPRPRGDVGNARTFTYPVQYEVLFDVAPADLTINCKPDAMAALISAAKRLERSGVGAIFASCGLLAAYQDMLTEAVNVPVASSSLLLLPLIGKLIATNKKIAVIASQASSITKDVLDAIGWDEDHRLILQGLEDCEYFSSVIPGIVPPYNMDTEEIYQELLGVCQDLLEKEPNVGAILLECTNLAPYSQRLKAALQLPIFDFNCLAMLLHQAVSI